MNPGHSIDAKGLIADAFAQMGAMVSADDQRKTVAFPEQPATNPTEDTVRVEMAPGMNGPGELDGNRFSSTRQRFG